MGRSLGDEMTDLCDSITYGPGLAPDGERFLIQSLNWQVQLPRSDAESLMVCIAMWLQATEEAK